MKALTDLIFTSDFFYSILRVTTPLLFASMGAVVSDVAGVPNIALEGMMLMAAFAGMFFSYLFGSAWAGLAFAILTAVIAASVLAFFTLYYKTNIILGGIAINSLASGGTIFFLYLAAHDKGTSVSLDSKVLPNINIPFIEDIPVLGPAVSGHNILTYLSILAVVFTFYLLKRTALGYHIRAVGEKKEAADSVGISVVRTQAGWIALAAEAMGQRGAIGTAATSLLFGVTDALSNAVATLGWPSDLVKTIPYCATLAGLAIFSIRAFRRARNA